MKCRRNPSQEQIAHYGKRLPYIVAALDKAFRYDDGALSLPPSWDLFGQMPHIGPTDTSNDKAWGVARRNILINIATVLTRTAWINKSMEKNKKSPYVIAVVEWYVNRSIQIPEDITKVQETLLEFHQGVLSGVIKGDAAKIENYHRQQDLAQYLKQLRKFLLKGGGYEALGCARVAELGKYVLFRIDDYETGEEAFADTNWCVRAPNQFRSYGPPYFMVVNTNVAEGHDDRVCLMHANSKQIKNVNDDRLARPIQKEIRPFMEFVFGRWACKYNMTDGDDGDLDIGDSWWALDATTPFGAVGEIIDVVWAVGKELVDLSEHISTAAQDQFYDDSQAEYKKEHPDDEEMEGFEDWFQKWGDSEKGSHELGMLEDWSIQECDVLTREAFDMFGGLSFDPECVMDYIIPKIFGGASWDKMKKLLNITPYEIKRTSRAGTKYTEIKDYTVGGHPRFNRNHATPKMEAWAERSIDRFLTMLPDKRDFSRYMSHRDSSVWSSLPGAKRASR